MNATFKIVSLKKYAGVGNKIGLEFAEYTRRKTAAELKVYGVTGGSYYLPVFEITFDNGVKVNFENSYDGDLIEECSPAGLNLKMANGDSLGYYQPDLIPLDGNFAVVREINPKYLNCDFAPYMQLALKGDEDNLTSLASQAAYAAGLRDCEVYVF